MPLAITHDDPDSPVASALLAALSATLEDITGDSGRASFDPDDVRSHRALFVVARSDGRPVGCGALRPLTSTVAEVKRMYAVPGSHAVGSALLAHLEREAVAFGYTEVWLSTRTVNERAVRFYERHGYEPIPAFGTYVGSTRSVCLGKRIE